MISIGIVEAFWFVVTFGAVVFSVFALADAIADQRAIRSLNGKARRIIGVGRVRRELVRLVINLALFILVVPALFEDRDIPVTPGTVVILFVPVGIFINSLLDFLERRQLSHILESELRVEREGLTRREMREGPVRRRRSTDHLEDEA